MDHNAKIGDIGLFKGELVEVIMLGQVTGWPKGKYLMPNTDLLDHRTQETRPTYTIKVINSKATYTYVGYEFTSNFKNLGENGRILYGGPSR